MRRDHTDVLRSDRGVALPMALMTLLLFSSLSLALVALAQTEPVIAANQLLTARARTMAESGLERALWALTHATEAGAFGGSGTAPNVTIAATALPPYDGSTFIAVGASGGFHVMVTGTDPNLRAVRATGFAPTSDPLDRRPKGRSEVVATLARIRNVPRDSPCALCSGGAMALRSVTVDARDSGTTECGAKVAVASAADLDVEPAARLFGAAAPADASAPVEGRDWLRHQAVAAFLSSDDLDTLKALAIVDGTYVRPPSAAPFELTDLRPGIVFVDTPGGTNAVSADNIARVTLGPGLAATPPFRGWLIVNGDVIAAAGTEVIGLVYAVNALVVEGPATVTGVVVSRQALGAAITVDGLAVRFDCDAARGGGRLRTGWFVKPGTYCDGSGGC